MWSANFLLIETMWALPLLMELGPHKERENLGGWEKLTHPGQSFSLSLCGPNSISRANAHKVSMGRKLALQITLYSLICSTISATRPTFAKTQPFSYNQISSLRGQTMFLFYFVDSIRFREICHSARLRCEAIQHVASYCGVVRNQ